MDYFLKISSLIFCTNILYLAMLFLKALKSNPTLTRWFKMF